MLILEKGSNLDMESSWGSHTSGRYIASLFCTNPTFIRNLKFDRHKRSTDDA